MQANTLLSTFEILLKLYEHYDFGRTSYHIHDSYNLVNIA